MRRAAILVAAVTPTAGGDAQAQSTMRDVLVVLLQTADGQRSVHTQMTPHEHCMAFLAGVAKARRQDGPVTLTFQAPPVVTGRAIRTVTGRVVEARCILPDGRVVRR